MQQSRHLNPRPNYEYPHPEHATALEDVQARIQEATATLDALKQERALTISTAVEDGMQRAVIGAHLGVGTRLVNQWLTEARELRRRAGQKELF